MSQEQHSPPRVVIVGLQDDHLLSRLKDMLKEAIPCCVVRVMDEDHHSVREEKLPVALEMLLQRISVGTVIPALIEESPDDWLVDSVAPDAPEDTKAPSHCLKQPVARFQHIRQNPCKQRAPPGLDHAHLYAEKSE